MSLRSLLSRLLAPRSHSHRLDNGLDRLELNSPSSDRHGVQKSAANGRKPTSRWRYYLVQFLIITTLLLSAVWLLMAIWYQFGAGSAITWLTAILIVGVLTALLSIRYWPKMAKRFDNIQCSNETTVNRKSATKWLTALYGAILLTIKK